MFLGASLLQSSDLFVGPLCFILLLMVFSVVVRKYRDERLKRLFLQAFYFKMAFALLYTVVNSYYYRGGDSEMYYHCTQFLHKAVMDDTDNFWKIMLTKKMHVKTELVNYFIYTNSQYPVFEAMQDTGNFTTPKLALLPALVFNKSYLAIAMIFSFFALGGSMRLFKFFYHFYPQYYREIALATLFLPSVVFWSSGLLKDTICYGSVGYLVYAIFQLFIRRRKIVTSIIWALVSVLLLFYIKVYILMAVTPAIVIWLFREVNKVIENKTLRNIMAGLTFVISIVVAIIMLNYVTSDESMRAFRLDAIMASSEANRAQYEQFGEKLEGSYFSIQTENPVLLILNGITATLFRPFLWEANSVTALLSSLEALFFLYLTLGYMFKKGLKPFFKNILNQPILLMCFVFSIIFAAAIGSTALNFGSLSRYKIPAMPFYLIMVLVLWQQAGLQFPRWFKRLLGYKSAPRWATTVKPAL